MKYIFALLFISISPNLISQLKFIANDYAVYKYDKYGKTIDSAMFTKKTIIIVDFPERVVKIYFEGEDDACIYDILNKEGPHDSSDKKDEIYHCTAIDPKGKKCSIYVIVSKTDSEDPFFSIKYLDFTYIFQVRLQ